MAFQKSAIVVRPFKGVRDGDVYPTEFEKGDMITGALAATMVAAGYAREVVAEMRAPEVAAFIDGAPARKEGGAPAEAEPPVGRSVFGRLAALFGR